MTKQKEADDREQKRYRTKAILAALGDGISSLANLYYTTRGAQGIPQPAASLNEVTKRRFDEAKRRKEKMEDEYRAALIRAGFADRAEAFQAARDDKNNAAADRRARPPACMGEVCEERTARCAAVTTKVVGNHIKNYRYRCVWRKARRINRFRAFSSPDFFF